ncbi:C39 family peptidase [Candidatus Parcubacteria bacterium]|nr:C39 family peptidase [Candidatus Parcubacteria bacterium]
MNGLKLKKVKQSSGFCGPASLSSLLHFYGIKMSERELGNLCETTAEYGTEPEVLRNTLRKLGFKAVAREHGTWEELKRLVTHETPVLVNWWSDYEKPADGHYSLVYKMTDKSIFLMDPELGGYRRMSKERFMRQWYDFYITGEKNTRWYLYIVK